MPSIKLNIVIYKEGNEWVAHCLQMDLVATGTNKKIVERDVINLIKSQVIFALDHDNMDNIFKPAPKEIWEMISHSKKCELKRIRLFAPDRDVNKRKPDHIPPIKEVEFCFA